MNALLEGPAVPLSHVPGWYAAGLTLWRRAPLMLLWMGMAPLAFEFAIQLLPVAGVLLSKLLTPLVGAGLVLGIDGLTRGQPLRARTLLAGFRPSRLPALLRLNLCLLMVFALQLLTVAIVYAPDDALIVLLGNTPPAMDRRFALTLILPGIVLATPLGAAMPLVVLRGLSASAALLTSLRWMARSPAAIAAQGAVSVVLVALSFVSAPAVLLLPLAMPLMLTAAYAGFRDLAGDPITVPRHPAPQPA